MAGAPDQDVLAKLTAGVWLSDGKIRAKRARLLGRQGQANVLELVLAEGKNREIRRMLAKLGHKVMSLNRVAVGPISVKGLSSGELSAALPARSRPALEGGQRRTVSLPHFLGDESSPRNHGESGTKTHRDSGLRPQGPARSSRAGQDRQTAKT